MYLKQKINAVNKIFRQADKHVAKFRSQSKLACVPKCGLCCIKPNIETSILEFLPAAYNLYLSGQYNTILENIEKKTDTVCVFYNPFSVGGFCTYYQNRGLLCRLFGFSKKIEKNSTHTFVTCKPIKQLIDTNTILDKIAYAPEMSGFYLKLYGIDPKLTVQYLSINQSIKKALDIVLLHFQYTKKQA